MGAGGDDVDRSLSNEYFYLSGIIMGAKKEEKNNPIKNPIEREPDDESKIKQRNGSSQINNTNPFKVQKKIEGQKNFVNLPYVTKISEEDFIQKSKNADVNNNNHDIMHNSKNQNQILNLSNQEIKNSKDYEIFDINKFYYLICPECDLYITNVIYVEYDYSSNDFNFKYKCSCKEEKENCLYSIIKEKKPKCKIHNNEIKFLCRDCNEQLCKSCINYNHNEHNIKNIISYEVISDSIMNIISEKTEEFKGYEIFKKLFYFYKNSPSITKKPDNDNEIEEKIPNENISKNNNQEIIENDIGQNNFQREIENKREDNDETKNSIGQENVDKPEEENINDKSVYTFEVQKITEKYSYKNINNINGYLGVSGNEKKVEDKNENEIKNNIEQIFKNIDEIQ